METYTGYAAPMYGYYESFSWMDHEKNSPAVPELGS
jgi:hypothetical protein